MTGFIVIPIDLLNLTAALWLRFDHLCYMDEETEALRVKLLNWTSELQSYGAGVCTQPSEHKACSHNPATCALLFTLPSWLWEAKCLLDCYMFSICL